VFRGVSLAAENARMAHTTLSVVGSSTGEGTGVYV
jgi:hypothetical protein